MTNRAAHLRAITGYGLTDPAAIRACWEDDTRRLIYADWLAENGEEERAEFIRCQVELAGMTEEQEAFKASGTPGRLRRRLALREGTNLVTWDGKPISGKRRKRCERFMYLEGRVTELFKVKDIGISRGKGTYVPEKWRDGLGVSEITEKDPVWWVHRGFIQAVTCSWQSWRDNADAIRQAHPVEEVELTTRPTYRVLNQNERDLHGPEAPFRGDNLSWLAKRWPAITFRLPPEPDMSHYRGVTHAAIRSMVENLPGASLVFRDR